MNSQLKFPFPRPAPTEEETSDPPVRERPRFPRHELGIDRAPFRMPTPPEPVPDAPLSREQRRSRRKRSVRGVTLNVRRLPKFELELGRVEYPADEHADAPRPKTRADCSAVPRPCPFVACIHHLYLDVHARTGNIKMNFPDLEVDELPADASCALDVADRDGATLEAVGVVMNLTRERVRQIEVKAYARLVALRDMVGLRDVVDGRPGQRGKRVLPVLEDVGRALDDEE